MNTKKVLIVYDAGNQTYWENKAEAIEAQIGPIDLILDQNISKQKTFPGYDLVLVDVSDIEVLYRLIPKIHQELLQSRIIVASSTPTWKQAREYIRLGAVNLIRKSADPLETINALQTV